jgi:hypothetical protein
MLQEEHYSACVTKCVSILTCYFGTNYTETDQYRDIKKIMQKQHSVEAGSPLTTSDFAKIKDNPVSFSSDIVWLVYCFDYVSYTHIK